VEFKTCNSLLLCVMYCSSLFVLFSFSIVLSVLPRFTNSDYSLSIFKLYSLSVTWWKLFWVSPDESYSERHLMKVILSVTWWKLFWASPDESYSERHLMKVIPETRRAHYIAQNNFHQVTLRITFIRWRSEYLSSGKAQNNFHQVTLKITFIRWRSE
jgi:hypothetical protein